MKNFNTYLVIALAGLFLFPIVATGQTTIGDIDPTPDHPLISQPRGLNMISCSAYGAITYNGHTKDEVNATEGKNSSIQSLWGTYSSVEVKTWEKVFLFDNNVVAFDTEENRVTRIEINNNKWLIKVLDKEIRVGDTFSELQQKFGSDLKIRYKPEINPNYAVAFDCSGNDYDGLLIDLNPETNKVIEITYFVNP